MTDSARWKPFGDGPTSSIEVFTGDLDQSPNDDRSYRVLRLQNGLEAVLVHDETADKAAASLDVAVGHLSDPDDMPGLAHFCEHLLFMGTKKFPKENDYGEFISANGGYTNAYTAASNTNYHFSVGPAHLRGALARFSSFFECPLFEVTCTARELNAVDSEHKKNRQQDGWRLFQLGKGLSKDGHKWAKFGSGNRESLLAAGRDVARKSKLAEAGAGGTLDSPNPSGRSPTPSASSETEPDGGAAGRETRRRLIEWWSNQYCASRMKLAIIGKESLDELTNITGEYFSNVPNRGLDKPLEHDFPLGPEQQGTIVFAKTVMDMHILEIAFNIPYQHPRYRSKPAGFLGHLIGHEGPGSIHSYLKRKGWLVSLEAGSSPLGRGFDCFRVTLTLTPDGLDNWQDIIVATYKYISMLQASSLQSFHHQEIKTLSDIRYRFKEKRKPDEYVTTLTDLLQRPYNREELLSASSKVWEWDEDEVRRTLNLLNVNTGRIMVMARNLDALAPEIPWEREQWYGTEYKLQRLPKEVLEKASVPNDIPQFFMPTPNPFIPENLNVEKLIVQEPAKRPVLVRDTPLSALWFKKDDRFWVPKASVAVNIKSPLTSISPLNTVMSRLVADLVTDSLTEYAYYADLAGLRYAISEDEHGLQLLVSGYNDKIAVLLRKVLETLHMFQVDPSRLAVMKEQLKLDYENFRLNHPFRISNYWSRYLLQEKGWTKDELLAVLSDVNPVNLKTHAEGLIFRVYMEILVHGNMQEEEAISIAKLVEECLQATPLEESERPVDRSLILPENSNYIWQMATPNENDVNSSICYYCHVGDVSNAKLRTLLSLFDHIAHEPCFDQLRTKEQLGYTVASAVRHTTSSMGWTIIVQSEREPAYLESRIEAFFATLEDKLHSMNDEEFNSHREGLIALRLEEPKNMGEEMSRLWTHIKSGYHDFHRRYKEADILKSLTRQDILEFFLTHIHPLSRERRKLSVQCKSQIDGSAKFNVEAAEAFCDDLQDAGVAFEREQFVQLAAKEPPSELVLSHWTKTLERDATVDDPTRLRLIAQLKNRIQEFCRTREDDSLRTVPTPTTPPSFIVDTAEFKRALTVSAGAIPVEDFIEFSPSKL